MNPPLSAQEKLVGSFETKLKKSHINLFLKYYIDFLHYKNICYHNLLSLLDDLKALLMQLRTFFYAINLQC